MRAIVEAPDDVPDYLGALNLKGQGFVVLGAGQGIGAQCAYALAQAGARLLCVDIDETRIEAIARATGGEAIIADAGRRSDSERIFARADAAFGKDFAGLVDIIGVAQRASLKTISDDEWDWQYNIVLRHAFYAMQHASPLLAANGGGAMTFVGSISGLVAIPGQSVYGAAKAALHHLVRQAALEFGPAGIRVNAIAPGIVKTPRVLAALSLEAWAQTEAANWLRRAANPSDIARAALFLSSDLARYVTANVLTLDGGNSHGRDTTIP